MITAQRETATLRKSGQVQTASAAARLRRRLGMALLVLLVSAGAVVLMIPLAWMLSTSLKPLGQIWIYPPQWLPERPLWENYAQVFTTRPYIRYLLNTIYLVVVAEIGTLLSCSLIAFGFARTRFPGRNLLFYIVLGTTMIPGYATLIPLFLLFRELGWLNTFRPLLVPTFFGSPIYIFLLRQFYMTIPLELDEAAKLDGCGYFGIYWRILIPLVKPALATVAIFTFIGHWNDYFGPLIYLMEEAKWPVALGLLTYRNMASGYYISWNILMAASFLTLIPVLIVFFFAQRTFIQGVVMTGIEK